MSPRELARAVAAYGLPDHDGPFLGGGGPQTPLDASSWSQLIAIVQHQRLTGYLHAAVDAGVLAVTDEQRQQVDELHLGSCSTVLRLERILVDLATELEAAGIEFVVLKGSASAHLVHDDPAVRMFGDNDLLFRTEEFEPALQVLRKIGYHQQSVPPTSSFGRRFAKGVTLEGPTGDELDAHRNLVFGTFGFAIEVDELFDSSTEFELGGRKLQALGSETRLLHACYHAGLGDPVPRLSSVRDVAQMLMTGAQDAMRVRELASRWKSEAVVARACQLCEDHLGVAVEGPIAEGLMDYEPTRREQRAIDSYVGADRSFAAKVLASLPYVEGLGERTAFLRAILVPSSDFAESRGSRRGIRWLLYGARSLFRKGRR